MVLKPRCRADLGPHAPLQAKIDGDLLHRDIPPCGAIEGPIDARGGAPADDLLEVVAAEYAALSMGTCG